MKQYFQIRHDRDVVGGVRRVGKEIVLIDFFVGEAAGNRCWLDANPFLNVEWFVENIVDAMLRHRLLIATATSRLPRRPNSLCCVTAFSLKSC
jgi:hypothetical protein